MSTFKAIVVLLTIKRGTHEIPESCPEHEIPILRALHPNGDIKILDKEFAVLHLEASAEAEYARLIRKYDTQDTQIVRLVYPTVDVIATHLDIPYTLDMLATDVAQPIASEQNDAGAKSRKAEAAEARAEKTAKGSGGAGGRRGRQEAAQGPSNA